MKATLAIEFDTSLKRETTKLEQIANIINDNSYSCSNASYPNTTAYEMTKQISDLKSQKEDLEKDIKRYQQQVEKDNSRIDKLNSDLDEKQNQIKQLEQKVAEKDKTIKDSENLYEQLIKDEQAKYRKLERDLNNQLNNQSQQIQTLKKKLENYERCGANIGEDTFYRVDTFSKKLLIETKDDKAPYIARAIDNEKCEFQFNINSGPVKEACNSNNELLIFCDVIEQEENASTIKWAKWGTARRNSSGDLIVESKAQVKLTRI